MLGRLGVDFRAANSRALMSGKGSVGSMGRTTVVRWDLKNSVQSVPDGGGVVKSLCCLLIECYVGCR